MLWWSDIFSKEANFIQHLEIASPNRVDAEYALKGCRSPGEVCRVFETDIKSFAATKWVHMSASCLTIQDAGYSKSRIKRSTIKFCDCFEFQRLYILVQNAGCKN